MSIEIEMQRNGTNRLRRELSIEAIKLLIEKWPEIIRPNRTLSLLIQNQLLVSKSRVSENFEDFMRTKLRDHSTRCSRRGCDAESTNQEVETIQLTNIL